jgi:hypothetical protein
MKACGFVHFDLEYTYGQAPAHSNSLRQQSDLLGLIGLIPEPDHFTNNFHVPRDPPDWL